MSVFRPDPKPDYTGQKLLKKSYTAKKKAEAAKSHRDFYNQVWQKNPHKCFECGAIVSQFHSRHIHHVIEKHWQGNYLCSLDQFENGVILCWNCHNQVHTNIDKTQKVKAHIFIMQKKYEQFRIKK